MYCAGGNGRPVTRRAVGAGVGDGVWAADVTAIERKNAMATMILRAMRTVSFD